jgi:hypothetical protein
MEAALGFEPRMKDLQSSAFPLGYAASFSINLIIIGKMERKTGFEPATLALARRCSTTELFPHEYEFLVPRPRVELGTRGFSVHCSTN